MNEHCISIWQPLHIVVQHCCIYNCVTKEYIMQMLRVCLGFILTVCFCDHFLYFLSHNNYLTIWAVSKWYLTKPHCELLLHTDLADEVKSPSACDSSDVRTWTFLHALLAHLASLHASASNVLLCASTKPYWPPPFLKPSFVKKKWRGLFFVSHWNESFLHFCRPDRRREVFSDVLANS